MILSGHNVSYFQKRIAYNGIKTNIYNSIIDLRREALQLL